jgi:hypothetical protein
MRKVRPDAVLKRLPEARQAEVADYAREHTLAQTSAWLKADGIVAGRQAISEFLSFWETQEALRKAEANANAFTEQLRTISPELDEDKLEAAGSVLFQTLAIQQQNPGMFLAFRKARNKAELDKAKLALAREKFEFNAAQACLAKLPELKVISEDASLDEDAKLQRVRERLFGEIPATKEAA